MVPDDLRSIITRWKDNDESAKRDFVEHPIIKGKIKSLVKRYVHKPIKARGVYQLSLGVVDGNDVVQTVRLVFVELVTENINKTPEEIMDAIDTNAYYAIQSKLLDQHGFERTNKGWVKPEVVSWELVGEIGCEDEYECEKNVNKYGFSDNLQNAINQLDHKEQLIVELVYGENQPLKQVANILGITRKRVSQLLIGRRGKRVSKGILEKLQILLQSGSTPVNITICEGEFTNGSIK